MCRSLFIKICTLLLFFWSQDSFSQSAPLKVGCIGNSVTYGYGLKNRELSAYSSQLQQLLGAGFQVRNFGVSGSTLLKQGHRPYYKTTAFTDMLAFAPDIAVIHLGLNDTDPRDWPDYQDEFAPDYTWLMDTLRQVNPAVQIFICRLTPIFHDHPRFKSGTRDWFWEIQAQIPQIATANKAGLIDLHTPLYRRPDLFPDALHPDEAGAAIIARTVYSRITGNYGGLQLSPVFASHMVIQRNKPVKFYGTANAGEVIHISFNGQQQQVRTNEQGFWQVNLAPMPAGGPFTATVITKEQTITLEDIMIGEVWLCAGQSNMAFPLKDAVSGIEAMQTAEQNSNIRLLRMAPLAETDNRAWDTTTLEKVNRLQYFSGRWEKSDSTTAGSFSAVAYYFGKKLQEQLQVPVGLIQVAVGGSTTESWIDRYTMEHDPQLVDELYHWRTSDFYQPWCRERADTNLTRSTLAKQRHPYEPCYNFEAGVYQFTGFPIQGVIWYQGESNAHNVTQHERLFPALVKSWRKQWGYAFPFYYVQLSSINRPSWPSFRNSQLQLLKEIPNTGMAVSSDVGDPVNVHPRHKMEVGGRLARLALHFTYQQQKIMPYGPMPIKAMRGAHQVVLSFDYTGAQLKTGDDKSLRGFTLVNDKGQMIPANASVVKKEVIITTDKNDSFTRVLYGWQPYTDANLVNEAGLPATTFSLKIN